MHAQFCDNLTDIGQILIAILDGFTVGVSMEMRFVPTATRGFLLLPLRDSLLPLRGLTKEKERKKNNVGSPNYDPHNLLLGKNENIFFVNLTGHERHFGCVQWGKGSLTVLCTKSN